MPNSSSAKKALRKNLKRRLHNRSRRSALRTMIKKFRAAVAEGNGETIASTWSTLVKRLDREADRGLLHKNAAARTKQRLARTIPSDVWKQMHSKSA